MLAPFGPRRLFTAFVAVIPLVVALFGPARTDAAPVEGMISGTVTYLQRMALPPDATVTVWLQDQTTAKHIAEIKIPTASRQVPIPFSLTYDPSAIDPARSYLLHASISSEGRVMFGSNSPSPVLTRGAGSSVNLIVQPVSVAGGTATLVSTYWKLVGLGGTPAVVLPDNREAHFILTAAGNSIAGTGGCNRMFGTYETGPDSTLTLKVGGMSMMACEEPLMRQETNFVGALNATTNYRIDGEKLELRKGEQVLARFESRYLK